jgi:acyl carrier protein
MQTSSKSEIMETLTPIFHEVFDNPSLVLRDDMTAADVEKWDSLSHIDMIVAVEHKFKIKFVTREVALLKNVGELVDLTYKKLVASR